jgi:hypothetical protein
MSVEEPASRDALVPLGTRRRNLRLLASRFLLPPRQARRGAGQARGLCSGQIPASTEASSVGSSAGALYWTDPSFHRGKLGGEQGRRSDSVVHRSALPPRQARRGAGQAQVLCSGQIPASTEASSAGSRAGAGALAAALDLKIQTAKRPSGTPPELASVVARIGALPSSTSRAAPAPHSGDLTGDRPVSVLQIFGQRSRSNPARMLCPQGL